MSRTLYFRQNGQNKKIEPVIGTSEEAEEGITFHDLVNDERFSFSRDLDPVLMGEVARDLCAQDCLPYNKVQIWWPSLRETLPFNWSRLAEIISTIYTYLDDCDGREGIALRGYAANSLIKIAQAYAAMSEICDVDSGTMAMVCTYMPDKQWNIIEQAIPASKLVKSVNRSRGIIARGGLIAWAI